MVLSLRFGPCDAARFKVQAEAWGLMSLEFRVSLDPRLKECCARKAHTPGVTAKCYDDVPTRRSRNEYSLQARRFWG